MKRFFLLMAVILLSSSGFISIEATAQTSERKVYSCAFDGFVNMREEPSYSAKKIGKFNNGPEGAVLLEHLGDWTKIDVSGTIGYVPTKYIQETPTIAYTGDVSVDWIEGIWKSESIASSLLIYNNGTWERGYDFEQAHGKYILQNNEIKFITIWCAPEMEFNEVLPINRGENRLGDYERGSYMTQEEKEENRDDDGEYFPLDYGTLTQEDFKAWGKQLLEKIESETSQPQELHNSQVESVVSQDTAPNEDVQDTASVDVVEEIANAKTPFFESEAFLWLKRALIAVLACLFVLWLARLIKKMNQRSKEKRSAKTQKEAKNAQNNGIDISKNTGKAQSRKKFPWAAVLIPAILVVAALAAIKILYDKQDTFSLEGEKYGFINKSGELVVPYIYDDAYAFEGGIAMVCRDTKDGETKYGFINQSGKLVVPCIYDDVDSDFPDGMARVFKNDRCGFINQSGKLVVPCKYESAEAFSDGMARVTKNGKHGYINKSGKLVIPCIYDGGGDFSDGMASVYYDRKEGYINKTGELVVPYSYDDAYPFNDGIALVMNDGKYGYINKTGELVVPCIYDAAAWKFSEGMARVMKNGKCGYINKSGELVVPCIYDEVYEFVDGMAIVIDDGKYGYINKTGELVVPCSYDRVYGFCDGMGRVKNYDKYGYINKSGELVVPYFYDDAYDYSDGMARVKRNGKYGYINKSGELVVPCIYYRAYDYSDGMALVVDFNGKKRGYINKSGEVVIPCIYVSLSEFSDGMAVVLDNGKEGFFNKSGELVIPCIFDGADLFSEGMARVMKDYGTSRGYSNSTEKPKEKQGVEIPSFQTPEDVIFYLSRHTFKSKEKGTSVVVKYDGVYADGYVLTTAPRVVGFSSDEASLMAHSPLNNADMHIDLVRQGDNYLLKVSSASYTIVENYYYAY